MNIGPSTRVGYALRLFLPALLLALLATGCVSYQSVQVEQVGRLGFTVAPSGNGYHLEVPVRVYNPNSKRITLLQGDFTFYFQSSELCSGKLLSDTLSLPPLKSEWVRVPVGIQFRSPGDELRLLWNGGDWKNALEVEGRLKAKIGIHRGTYRLKRTPVKDLSL